MKCFRERFSEKDENGNSSGMLQNSEKTFSPQAGAAFVREVSNMRKAAGMLYARKAMIQTIRLSNKEGV